MPVRVRVDLKGLKPYRKVIKKDLYQQGRGLIDKALRKWAYRYRLFIQKRYTRASHGDGTWRPLKEATIARKGHDRILIETRALWKALRPEFVGLAGQFEKRVPKQIIVGYGPGEHPTAGMSFDDLAMIHQRGQGNVPRRPIIVPPDKATLYEMTQDMQRALYLLGKQTGVA